VTGNSTGGGSYWDYATIQYSSAGAPLCTNRYNGPANGYDYAKAVAVDDSNNVIVTGFSPDDGSSHNFATIKYFFPLLITQSRLTNGTFEMLLDNLQPRTLVIEASTSLSAEPPGWLPVFSNTTPTNVLFYTDPDAGEYPIRYYRAFQSP
jgi:hypothetical protein